MGAVTDPPAKTPRSRPATPAGHRAFLVAPFQRLARSHAASAMADAMVAASLADSLFFSLPADDARSPVVRYLIITMLPFAVIAPLVGPLIDRLKGGHRFVLVGSAVARAGLCYLMIDEIRAGGAPFFLLALCVLVAQRAYNVARSALVPTVVMLSPATYSAVPRSVGVSPVVAVIACPSAGWRNRPIPTMSRTTHVQTVATRMLGPTKESRKSPRRRVAVATARADRHRPYASARQSSPLPIRA